MKYNYVFKTILLCSFLGGCATIKPIDRESYETKILQKKAEIYTNSIVEEGRQLNENEVVALVLLRNPDILTKDLEWMQKQAEKSINNLKYLPEIYAQYDKRRRSKLSATTSNRLDANGDEINNIDEIDTTFSYSTPLSSRTATLGASFDFLNLWKTYIESKKLGNEQKIAELNRQRAAQLNVSEALGAYYLDSGNKLLGNRFEIAKTNLVNQTNKTCNIQPNSVGFEETISLCDNAFSKIPTYIKAKQQLNEGSIKLATLLAIPQGHNISIKPITFKDFGKIEKELDELIDYAIRKSPAIEIEEYRKAIENENKKLAWVDGLPSIEVGVEIKSDDNDFLLNDSWTETFFRINWNIFGNLISAPYKSKLAKYKYLTADSRQNALIHTTAMQVAIAYSQYESAREQWLNTYKHTNIKRNMLKIATSKKNIGSISGLEYNIKESDLLEKETTNYITYLNMTNALFKLYQSMGIRILPNMNKMQEISADELAIYLEKVFSELGIVSTI